MPFGCVCVCAVSSLYIRLVTKISLALLARKNDSLALFSAQHNVRRADDAQPQNKQIEGNRCHTTQRSARSFMNYYGNQTILHTRPSYLAFALILLLLVCNGGWKQCFGQGNCFLKHLLLSIESVGKNGKVPINIRLNVSMKQIL